MRKRKKKSGPLSIRIVLLLAAGAALLFAAGEVWKFGRSDSGRVLLAARVGFGDPARVTQIVGREIRRGLAAARIPADSIQESVGEGDVRARWRVGVAPQASLIQTNYAVTKRVSDAGAEVTSGREHTGPHGEGVVTLRIGLPRRPLHEVVLVRARRDPEAEAMEPARVAIVLYGFGDDPDRCSAFFALALPFAAAVVPGSPSSARLFHEAHAHDREVVMHLPLEPINYPRVTPGQGTVLVTMNEAKIATLLHRHFEQAGSVVAVANAMGSLATQDMSVMTAVFHDLKRRHLPFLHVEPTPGAVCGPLAAKLGVAYQQPDAVLDEGPRGSKTHALDRHWKALLDQARGSGHLLVMMRATPELLAWLPGATSVKRLSGVSLVPLSSLIRHPTEL